MNRPLDSHAYSLDLHEGRALWHLNALLTFKALSVETNGLFWMMECLADSRFGMTAHQHNHEDEVLYILEGEIVSLVNQEKRNHRAGGFVYIPRGVPHTLQIRSERARWLNIGISGNLDQWFFETGEPAQALILPPPTEYALRDLSASLNPYGMHIVRPSSISMHPKSF